MNNVWCYITTCPFCGKQHIRNIYINAICDCGAKYYVNGKYWLNRKNGEVVKDEQRPNKP